MSTPNPYAAPKAPVADTVSAMAQNFLPRGRTVAAGRGWSWIVEGFDYFRRQPGLWIALVIIATVIFIALAVIPILGGLALMVLTPVFAAGMLAGCRAQEEGRSLEIGHLFTGFRERFGPLASVGLIYLGLTVVIALVVGVVTGAGMWRMMSAGADPAAMAEGGMTLALAVLIMMGLLVPVFMATWFAPALVHFHEQGAGEAMKASFIGCLKNIVPFLLYGVILFFLAILASLPFGLGWLVLGPTVAASLYAGYRDIFFQ